MPIDNETVKTFASTGLVDILRLIGGSARAFVRNPVSHSSGLVLSNWIGDLIRRNKGEALILNLLFKKMLLVTGKDLSKHILGNPPSARSYIAGPTKVKGMSFLAPQALTICHDQKWQRLRSVNEQVLSIAAAPEFQQAILGHVHQAFSQPISCAGDLRRCMGEVMLGVVFGRAPAHLAHDIDILFGYVTSPLKRKILGRKQRGRRDRFYATIQQLAEETSRPKGASLLNRVLTVAEGVEFEPEELSHQIPHWMFTFTGSGTDLLLRTLAIVGSRPDVREKVQEEIFAVGPLDQSTAVGRLRYLEACILETCRLFPPVTSTFHVAPHGDRFGDFSIRSGMEIWHYFPANNRDTSVDRRANDFQPDRWLDTGSNSSSEYPNLFLSGARACPGEDLVLFVCKASITILLDRGRTTLSSSSLANDPLPFSFPERTIRFTTNYEAD